MPPCQIAVAATFNADPLVRAFRFWKAVGIAVDAAFAPYNQVFQQLVDPEALLRGNASGVNVLLVRFEDWWDGAGPPESQVSRAIADFAAAVRSAASGGGTWLVVRCPDPPGRGDHPGWRADAWERDLSDLLEGVPAAHLITAGELEAWYPVADYHSEQGERLGHVPYSAAFFAALATAVVRRVHTLRAAPCKVIVLDGDQTLWAGICGEDGPAGVHLTPPYEALQRFMVAQRQAGRLLCLVSKNAAEDVDAVFEHHPEMPLRLDHFVARRVNWEPKSANIRAIAEELGLGMDSFAFVDDSAVECAEVQAHCPEVLTLQLPTDPLAIPRFLHHVWAFDTARPTEEDAQRASRYRDQMVREQARAAAPSFASFLANLQLDIDVRPLAPDDLDRAAQLTQRTNQFNATGRRMARGDMEAWLVTHGHGAALAAVSDRFGDYGIVGLILHREHGPALVLETLLLSCRALGRGVEFEMVRAMGRLALSRGLATIEIPFVQTPKNEPVQNFLRAIAADRAPAGAERRRFELPAEAAAALVFEPGQVRQDRQPVRRPPTDAQPAPPPANEHAALLARIAAEMADVPSILTAMTAPGAAPLAAMGPDAPRTPAERTIAGLWAATLNSAPPGRDDNFFESGGDSLDATILLAHIHKTYGVALGLQAFFDAPSVSALARAVQLHLVTQAGAERIAAALRELDAIHRGPAPLADIPTATAARRTRIDPKENGAAHA
jgi:FkbH-like protein